MEYKISPGTLKRVVEIIEKSNKIHAQLIKIDKSLVGIRKEYKNESVTIIINE